VSQMTSGSDIASQTSVAACVVCDHAEMERPRARGATALVGEVSGDGEGLLSFADDAFDGLMSGGGNCLG
jgi:hypothetical protein